VSQHHEVGRIGFLRVGPPPAAFIDGFLQGLSNLGFLEGRHFIIAYALTQSAAQMPEAAAELVWCRPETPPAVSR
jgi:hypothetical protein